MSAFWRGFMVGVSRVGFVTLAVIAFVPGLAFEQVSPVTYWRSVHRVWKELGQ